MGNRRVIMVNAVQFKSNFDHCDRYHCQAPYKPLGGWIPIS